MTRVVGVTAGTVSIIAVLGAGCANSDADAGFGGGRDGGDAAVDSNDELHLADGPNGGSTPVEGDPTTCAEASEHKTYIGCDYWPTVVANNVWSIFDFAVVVANGQSVDAVVTVTGPSNTNQSVVVPAGQLTKIYLPWVASLKGPDTDACGKAESLPGSVQATGGAYHLVSSLPVTVYQFNALEYRGAGGPRGKSWAACPGNFACPSSFSPIGCYSFSNDASLLIPSTAMTGNYRVTGEHGWSAETLGAYFAVTAVQDDTSVTVHVSSTGQILAGGVIPATGPNGNVTFTMNAGDVAELVGGADDDSDLSGSLVQATHPVQVISGVPCIQQPIGSEACDHIEQVVFPAETLGKDYVVTVPTGPQGNIVGHIVRVYGNVDGTELTYDPERPSGCPTTIDAGQVVDCGMVTNDFEVKGSHAFAVGSFMLGGVLLDPNADPGRQEGDPSQSLSVAVEQYRTKYIFLAPDDYDISYVDIIASTDIDITLDDQYVTIPFTRIGTTGYLIARVLLQPGTNGSHVITSNLPIGVQVMGYGAYTSYQYPAGLNLTRIAPPPTP
jgi:hypothetical protein